MRSLSEDEIERIAAEDPDNPATLSEEEWADASVGPPSAVADEDGRRPGKRAIRARFDSDVVAFFERGGRDSQERMNAVLRRYMEARLAEDAEG